METVGDVCFRGGTLWGAPARGRLRVGAHVGWKFDAPPGTEIVNYRISRSMMVGKPSAGDAAPVYYV